MNRLTENNSGTFNIADLLTGQDDEDNIYLAEYLQDESP